MLLRTPLLLAAASVLAAANFASAGVLTALSTFGGGDGWLAPGEGGYTFLGTGNNERGLAFGNGHVYLVSRTGGTNVRILDSSTGADLGGLSVSGISGGSNFAVNAIAVGGDGAIYVGNNTITSGTVPFKVYKWTTEGSTPTVAASILSTDAAGLGGARLGDSLAAYGSGSSTRLAAGYNSSPTVTGNNGYAIIDPTAGTSVAVGFTGSPPTAGDFRLGITFVDASHVLGSQGSSLYRSTSFSGSTGTLISSPAIPDPSGATADRLLAATVVDGVSILAVQSIGDSHVSIYNISNPSAPVYLGSGLNVTGTPATNANGTGELAWGPSSGSGTSATANLYAMSTNQGIQAFTFTLPEPASLSVILGTGIVALRRRK